MTAASPACLVTTWRADAATLRRYGAEQHAQLWEAAADQLESALEKQAGEILTLVDAAEYSGYSARHLSRLIREGKIANLGRPNAPKVRLVDLPKKPTRLPNRRPKHQVGGSTKEQIVQSIVNQEG